MARLAYSVRFRFAPHPYPCQNTCAPQRRSLWGGGKNVSLRVWSLRGGLVPSETGTSSCKKRSRARDGKINKI